MSVNIFGSGPESIQGPRGFRGPPGPPGPQGLFGIGFKYLDEEGNFDIDDKRLANVAFPQEKNDVTTKVYTDNLVKEIRSKVDETLRRTENMNKSITELQSEDDHIKKFVEEMKSQLFDIHNNVLMKEGFESALKTINKQISTLDKNRNNNLQICAYETIIFQTNSKLEVGKFLFVLGMKGAASKKTGYVMPYDGFIDTIIVTSQDIDQYILVKLFINGDEFKDLDIDKYKDDYYRINRIRNIHLNEGDIINFQAASDTTNEKSMHTIQVFLKYNLGKNSEENMLRDEAIKFDEKNKYEIYSPPKINDGDMGKEKNEYELVLKENHSNIEENIDIKNIIINDDFGNIVYSSDNTDAEIKRSYGDNIF
ncbi:UNVERIFIED_CONTAM: hypothetical protein RMT77_008344 [Armadillidium vulgare]